MAKKKLKRSRSQMDIAEKERITRILLKKRGYSDKAIQRIIDLSFYVKSDD